jgi:predicted MFS family arabinose efflux permease
MTSAAASSHSKAPLYWLALGTFAIGTEGFMIAPLLPDLAADLSVSVVTAGQLVTVFALTYAFSSPILTALTGSVDRRKLLILSMTAFALANVVAWSATDYRALMGARILLAFAAGLYVPSANALAGAFVEPERRGAALAIVNGGTTIAIAIGVPLGAIVGDRFGWRLTFAGVGVLASIATAGLLTGLARNIGGGLPVASLGQRLAVVRRPAILTALLVTTLWATGAYTVYTYLASFLASATGIAGPYVGMVLFMWGVAAAVGVVVGGTLNDRFGSRSVISLSLLFLALAFMSLSASAGLLSRASALAPVLVAIIVWGVSAWSFFPAQQARLIGIAGPKLAPVVLSLNASFMFIGFSLGAVLGSLTLANGSPAALGWVGGTCVIASLLLMIGTTRRDGAPSRGVFQQQRVSAPSIRSAPEMTERPS